jgi:hypothetical protein
MYIRLVILVARFLTTMPRNLIRDRRHAQNCLKSGGQMVAGIIPISVDSL